MANLNFIQVLLGGRLTADPENKQTQNGISVTKFTLAVNRRLSAEGEQRTDFFNVSAFGKTADFVYKFFKKGSSIFVVSTLKNRSWTDNDGKKRYATDIVAEDAYFVDSKPNSLDTGDVEKPGPLPCNFCTAEELGAADDDLPF